MDGGFDPAEGVWTGRPPLSAAPVWAFDSGVTRREKLGAAAAGYGGARYASHPLLTDLTDAAWTLELRGGDVACTPVFLGFLLLGREEAVLWRPGGELPGGHPCGSWRRTAWRCAPTGTYPRSPWRRCPLGTRVMADSATANARIAGCLAHTEWLDADSPASRRKAVKSAGEQEGFRRAHVQDGAAMCRFL